MNFGRAALLGLSGGGECDTAYPKCPRDEEQMLLYLNNHRGGFFRFFNGGNSFGDDSYLQTQQFAQQQSQLGGLDANQGLNLLALQSLASTLNQGGNGINLSNLFSSPSNNRPAVQPYPGLQADQSSGGFFGMFKPNGLTDIVSNLLTGVVGNRFSRRLSKRSLPDEGRHRIEKRIINLKENDVDVKQNFFQGPSNEQSQQQNTLLSLEEPFTFSNENRINVPATSSSVDLNVGRQEVRLSEFNQGNFISPSDVARRLKMLFPEATGHLRFDNDQLNRELLKALVNDRIGKILTGVQQQQPLINGNYDINRNQYLNAQGQYQRYPVQQSYAGVGSTNYNNNKYQSNRGQQQQQSSGGSHIVYITNAQGQNEYTLNELTGEKKRIY